MEKLSNFQVMLNNSNRQKAKQKDMPVIKCFFDGRNAIFHCPYCRTFHSHGSYPNGDFEGHRYSHCHNDHSKFRAEGYYLKKYTIKELKEIKQWVESSLKHRGK